jgi:prephenate dehydrogenase
VWVLTPSAVTDDATLLAVRSVVASLGVDVVAVPADRHDALVAVVSHVPHLTAATLMGLAGNLAEDQT